MYLPLGNDGIRRKEELPIPFLLEIDFLTLRNSQFVEISRLKITMIFRKGIPLGPAMLSIRKPPRKPPGGFPGQNPETPRGVSRSKIRKPPTWIAYSYNTSKLHRNPPMWGVSRSKIRINSKIFQLNSWTAQTHPNFAKQETTCVT